MPKFTFHIGANFRCYGDVEVEAESIEAALPLLTADYIGENIEIAETTTDSGQHLAIIEVHDTATGEPFLGQCEGQPLPSEYDPKPDSDMLAFIKTMANLTTPEDEFVERSGDDGTVYDNGVTYYDSDEMLADISDDRLMDEYECFCNMIREARRIRDKVEG